MTPVGPIRMKNTGTSALYTYICKKNKEKKINEMQELAVIIKLSSRWH